MRYTPHYINEPCVVAESRVNHTSHYYQLGVSEGLNRARSSRGHCRAAAILVTSDGRDCRLLAALAPPAALRAGGSHEAIPDAGLRHDQPGADGILFQLLAQIADVHAQVLLCIT